MTTLYPVQIQAANDDAHDSEAPCLCHVFDKAGETVVFNALSKAYCHVISWDVNGVKREEYDNR